MPGVCLHLKLALQLHGKEQVKTRISLDEKEVWSAYCFGSISPDMGVFPGGDPMISDLAHYERTGELCRAMLSHARTNVQQAFVWGWISHVIADALLHPLINRGVGELLRGDRSFLIAYAENPCAHVQIELGLDAAVVNPLPFDMKCLDAATLRTVQDEVEELVVLGFAETYGNVDFRGSIGRSLRALRNWQFAWIRLAQLIASGRKGVFSTRWLSEMPLSCGRLFTAVLPRTSALRGLFRTVAPSGWLLNDCDAISDEFLRLYCGYITEGIADLPNYNLDTGEIDGDGKSYPPAVCVHKRLMERIAVNSSTATT